ncbi:MAG: glycosyltransferase [Polyangiales bacterium]
MSELEAFADDGTFQTLLAVESLAKVQHHSSDDVLTDFLSHSAPIVRRHASWRLGQRLPSARAMTPLLAQLTLGGVDTLHAYRTLRHWASINPRAVTALVEKSLADEARPGVRARYIDLLASIEGGSRQRLLRIAEDRNEAASVRIAAIGALGERTGQASQATLRRLARCDDAIGAHAALALQDLAHRGPAHRSPASSSAPSRQRGLRVAQLVLAGGLDGQLSLGGRGETGGVASLLVSLGEALARREDVGHVLTIGRGSVSEALTASQKPATSSLEYGMIAIGDDARCAGSADESWEHLATVERGLRRLLRRSQPDVLHLRMADVGTLAGAEVARAMGMPICFSVAPDPHNVLHSMQTRGELDQESFVRLDTKSHVWFRARLIERLTRKADRLALFPRSRPAELVDLLGVDVERRSRGVAFVAEGIDVNLIRRARDASCSETPVRKRNALADLAHQIPESRRHLPLLLSVGRLHPVKGMERVVAAWASDPTLRESCNLVIVGGDLSKPSLTERAVLNAIDREVPRADPRRAGLVLLGGRPRADVAELLVAAGRGVEGCWAPGGVYVNGALKEEFGLALLEALAAGLVVTAPSTGGPPTYVDHGDTGILAAANGDLSQAIRDAYALVGRPGRATRARTMVEERYSVEKMADQLANLYRGEAAPL